MKNPGAVAGLRRSRSKTATALLSTLSSYATVGAICESSRWLAQSMYRAIGSSSLPIVELGAGYGSVTGVLPDRTVSIERDGKRFDHLRSAFPGRTIIPTCAIAFLADLKESTLVVSSIPSVNNPEFHHLHEGVARAYRAGTVSTLVTYTYFPHNPFAGIFPTSKMVGIEFLNIPPAFIWRYSC